MCRLIISRKIEGLLDCARIYGKDGKKHIFILFYSDGSYAIRIVNSDIYTFRLEAGDYGKKSWGW